MFQRKMRKKRNKKFFKKIGEDELQRIVVHFHLHHKILSLSFLIENYYDTKKV